MSGRDKPAPRDRGKELASWSKPKAETKPRACITCGTVFKSQGAHHRMCGGCRHNVHDADPNFAGGVIQ